MKNEKVECATCVARLNDLPANRLLGIETGILNKPKRVLTFSIPVKMDNGSVRIFNAYRVQYNDALGPMKGGIRYHEQVDVEEVKVLAFLMSLKTSLVGLPYGGAKGGIEVNPSELSETELERLTRGFTRAAHQFIGPDIDIPAPDVNTNGQIMAWIVDEYAQIKGKHVPGVVTGKPIALGGSLGRETSTSLGGAFVLNQHILDSNKKPEETTVAIQGYGNVGKNIAEILQGMGYKIVAISDVSGAFYNKDGIDVMEVCADTSKACVLKDMGLKAQSISNAELLELDIDVLIPAALENQITKDNADNIKAHTILEMANAPVTKEADAILTKADISVIPDILANSGGVIVSYYEWVQNTMNDYWTEEFVQDKLEKKIVAAYTGVRELATTNKVSLRESAYELSVKRILEAEKLRGHI